MVQKTDNTIGLIDPAPNGSSARGRIDLIRNNSDARRGQVRVMVKLHGESPFLLFPIADNKTRDAIKQAIAGHIDGSAVNLVWVDSGEAITRIWIDDNE